jgi:uncharacterized protein (DUF58 family)
MSRPHVVGPSELLSLRDLELATRTTVEGLRQGLHRSPFHGYSAEFSQYRHYRPGDDLRYVDWKAFARTDRLYTRQFRETTNMAALFVVDVSRSMDYPPRLSRESGVGSRPASARVSDDAELRRVRHRGPSGRDGGESEKHLPLPGLSASKFSVARAVTAVLGTLVLDQGDAAGLLAVDGQTTYVAPRSGHHHLRVFMARLAELAPSGDVPVAASLKRAADLLKRRGLVVVVSDFYDDGASLPEVKRLSRMGHDVIAIQTLAAEELTLPAEGAAEFEDLESGRRLMVDPDLARPDYARSVSEWLAHVRRELSAEGLDYLRLTTADSLDGVLRRFLVARRSAA